MTRTMAVLGTGAIGGSIAADLTRAGYDVLLIDQWPAHVLEMKSRGLRVVMPDEEFTIPVRAVHLCEMRELKHWAADGRLDIVFLAVKSYDTAWMVHFIEPFLKSDGVLVSMQNSLNDEWIAPIIGRERDIGCALELSAQVFEPGLVKRNTDRVVTKFVLGELDGSITSRLQEVAQILSAVGKTQVTTNIWGAKWTKLVLNNMTMGLGAIVGVKGRQMVEDPRLLDISVKLGKETAQVGTALGYRLEPIFGLVAENFLSLTDSMFRKLVVAFLSDLGRGAGSCVAQDLLKGRLTETSFLNGLVVKRGREAGVPTPANRAVDSLMREIEQGTLKPGLSNLPLLERLMEEPAPG